MLASLMIATALTVPLPEGCAGCHAAQAEEWSFSLHAQADRDPLVLAMREWARVDAGEAAAAVCVTCHTVAATDGSARTKGVTCPACHQGVASGPGPSGWRIGAARPASKGDHPTVATQDAMGETLCLVCHAELRNPRGVPLCTTGPESRERAAGPRCSGCHPPHAFAGATAARLAAAAALSIDRTGDRVTVAVINRGAGHALPTGSAIRQIRLEVEFLDTRGRVLWTNAGDAAATFARILRDDQGHAPVPPWRATAVASDTRLAPGERRALAYAIPPGAREVAATLVYHRAPRALAERLGLAQDPALAPVVMTRFHLAL